MADAPENVYDTPAPTPAVSPPRTDENVDYVPEILEPCTPYVPCPEEIENEERNTADGNMGPPPAPTSSSPMVQRPTAQATQAQNRSPQNSHRYRLGNPSGYRNPIHQPFPGPSPRMNVQIAIRPPHENPMPMRSDHLRMMQHRRQVCMIYIFIYYCFNFEFSSAFFWRGKKCGLFRNLALKIQDVSNFVLARSTFKTAHLAYLST